MKILLNQVLILSLIVQSFSMILSYDQTFALGFNPFVADISADSLEQTSSELGNTFSMGDESGDDLTE